MERKFIFNISKKDENKEIKTILEKELKCSANIISKLKKGNCILLNSKKATVRQKLSCGDVLEIIIPKEKSDNIISNKDISIDVIYEDEDILAINKQPGIPTHPSLNHYSDTLANGIMHYYCGDFKFRAINRLDREISGIVLIAKNILCAHLLSEQVKNRKIKKVYYAILEQIPFCDEGIIDAPIARERESIIKRCVRNDGKEAKTFYKILKKREKYAIAEAEPITGRTHQIRVHFSYIGCPLYGDEMYGSSIKNERVRLHCKKLVFCHPITNKIMELECSLPKDFEII